MLHLRHHNDSALTDPYDDPESFYYAIADWQRLPAWLQKVLDFNNTFLGRFTDRSAGHVRRLRRPRPAADRQRATGRSSAPGSTMSPGLRVVLVWASTFCGIPSGSTCSAPISACRSSTCRTFAEHQAHETPGGRTVIVEASPVFGLLFLNNNLHYVHHENPRVPWYKLPALYRANRAAFLAANESYSFKGYGEMIRRYLFRPKAPVPHPFLRRG